MDITDFWSFVDGQVQVSAQVQPRSEFQDSGLRIVRPVCCVRLAVYGVLNRFNPDHRAVSAHHAVNACPIVFHVGVDAESLVTVLVFVYLKKKIHF